jgi:hypothetical protein
VSANRKSVAAREQFTPGAARGIRVHAISTDRFVAESEFATRTPFIQRETQAALDERANAGALNASTRLRLSKQIVCYFQSHFHRE